MVNEKLYQTFKIQVFHPISKYFEQNWLKKNSRASFFQPTSQCLENQMKHTSSCLVLNITSMAGKENSMKVESIKN